MWGRGEHEIDLLIFKKCELTCQASGHFVIICDEELQMSRDASCTLINHVSLTLLL